METRSAAKPSRYTRLVPRWLVNLVPSSEALTDVINHGKKSVPYWVLDRLYLSEAVWFVLAHGNVAKSMPCSSPAAFTVILSVWVAIPPTPLPGFAHIPITVLEGGRRAPSCATGLPYPSDWVSNL